MDCPSELLAQLGPIVPTKLWIGNVEPVDGTDTVLHERVLAEASYKLFGAEATIDEKNLTPLDCELALSLVALAHRPPFLTVLGSIGRDGQFLTADRLPAPEMVDIVRSIVTPLGGNVHCLCNVDDTGAYSEVDRTQSDLIELLVVMYSSASRTAAAFYWGQPID